MNRRGFLRGMLALGVAPAVVSSGVLMPVRKLLLPSDYMPLPSDYEEMQGGFLGDSPVNFVLMQSLLEAARKKLPYFDGALVVGARRKIDWDRITFQSGGACMT